jgi:transposase
MPEYIAAREVPEFRLLNERVDVHAERVKLRARIATLEQELARRIDVAAENRQLKARLTRLEAENAQLKEALEAAQRAGKRQAAPFAKGKPKARPKRSGRKRGHRAAHRPPPTPTEINHRYDAALPSACPDCGGALCVEGTAVQYQIDIPPVQPVTTQFNIQLGHCTTCGTHLQGHHPLQISDALGAANIVLGPRVLALVAELKHDLGVPYTKIVRHLESAFGLPLCRATLARADQRLADVYLPTYAHLILALQHSAVVWADETGWRLGGHPAWLWVFTTETITVYVIDPSRAHAIPEAILGPDFAGILEADCLRTYDALPYDQQKCLQHFIRRGLDIHAAQAGPAADFSRRVVALLRGAIHLQHRYQAGKLSAHGYAVACGRLEAALDRLLAKQLTNADNVRLATSLQKHRAQLFRFLYTPGVTPTNAPAEQEIRPAVVIRKSSACNRSGTGAYAHQVLASIMRTCRKNGQSFSALTHQRLLHPTAPLPDWLTNLRPTTTAPPAMGSP